MDERKRIILNMDFINNGNITSENNLVMSERQINFKKPEKIIRNLEPRDNMKRVIHNPLIKSKNEQNLELDLDNSEINKIKQIQKNNLYEKNTIKSLTELNTKKTIGFFNNEKEKNKIKENLIKKKNDSLFNVLNNNQIMKKENNNTDKIQMISLDFDSTNNLNNNIKFNDNKIVHIKNRKNIQLLKNNIFVKQDIIDNILEKKGNINNELFNNNTNNDNVFKI